MSTIKTIVVYEDGVLRPLEKLNLPEHQKVRIIIETLPLEEETAPFTFPDEDVPSQNLHELLKETPPEYIVEGYSDSGLMTRAEFMAALKSYEIAHNMSSDEFHRKWLQGEMPDDIEFIMWVNLYQIYLQENLLFKDEVPIEEIVGQPEE